MKHSPQIPGIPVWKPSGPKCKVVGTGVNLSLLGTEGGTLSFKNRTRVSRVSAHIFVDNSNIFGGARRVVVQREREVAKADVRVYYRNLFLLVERGHDVATRELAGSVPPGNEELWDYARDAGYNPGLLRRIEVDGGQLAEQGVDELLHLKIANVLLDFYDGPQSLVLVTGDGRVSEFGTSFPLQVERALRLRWQVEVWSWRTQLSNEYRRLARNAAGFMNVHELDDYYDQITFIRDGRVVVPLR